MNEMKNSTATVEASFDAVIVGAGFAGLYMLHRLRGLGLRVRLIEAGGDVGGTWYWNRYPGCRCDVESFEYSYAFSEELEQSWHWHERYAPQAEILAYAQHVADRFDLRRDIEFNRRVVSANFDNADSRWTISTDQGERLRARFCIMATGCLSAGRVPEFPGLTEFKGRVLHTSTWPWEGARFDSERVAVMGVGSSGVQAIPLIAEQARHLSVLLRTPNYVVPARNGQTDEESAKDVKRQYRERRALALTMPGGVLLKRRPESALAVTPEERRQGFEERWTMGGAFNFVSAFSDIQTSTEPNRLASEFVRDKIRETVRDPKVAAGLVPSHLMGTRRLCVGTDYYETYNRSNVDLVNLRDQPIVRFTSSGVVVGQREIELDTMVFATGFDAMTGALGAINIVGSSGRSLRAHWSEGPRTYLGLASASFPNMFFVTGPGSPSVLSNVVVSIEQHVEWISECLRWMGDNGHTKICAQQDAEDGWGRHVNEVGQASLLSSGDSWYLGSNVPGKPRVFMPYAGGVPAYRSHCQRVASEGYAGFSFN